MSRELDARDYRKADGNADLLVNFNANAREKVDILSTPGPAVGYYGYRTGLYARGPQVTLLWEGVAEGELTDEVMKNPQAAVDKAVAQIFTQIPGHAAP